MVKAAYNGCLNNPPQPGELFVYKYTACPLGQMKVYGISPIKSLQQGLVDQRYTGLVYDTGNRQEVAISGASGVVIYKGDVRLLGVVLLLKENVYGVIAVGNENQFFSGDDDITACLGEDNRFVCISALNLRYWWTNQKHTRNWVAWIKRPGQ